MRILVIGPHHDGGSIPPYLAVFTTALRHLGVRVERLGSAGVPYDHATGRFWPADRILATAHTLLAQVDLTAYDILSVHFGNLEIEQLLPLLWHDRPRPPAVYHAHSLDHTLFAAHVPDPTLRAAVSDGIAAMDGYLCFGSYAREKLTATLGSTGPKSIAWLPTTIPPHTTPRPTPRLHDVLRTDGRTLASLFGYAAPWKNPANLIAALTSVRRPYRAVLAGPFWDQPDQAGHDLTMAVPTVADDHAELAVIADYLDAPARAGLIAASDLGVFPYQPQPTFQGSGAIADYLAHGVPVVATDVANMAELVGPAGMLVPTGDPTALADALDQFAAGTLRHRQARETANQRSGLFTAEHHARTCLKLYQAVLDARRSGVR